MIEKDALVEEVLSYINSARILAGYIPLNDLRKGIKGKERYCPIAKSFSDWIPDISIEGGESGYGDQAQLVAKAFKSDRASQNYVNNPDCFEYFIELFDDGKYPQYEE